MLSFYLMNNVVGATVLVYAWPLSALWGNIHNEFSRNIKQFTDHKLVHTGIRFRRPFWNSCVPCERVERNRAKLSTLPNWLSRTLNCVSSLCPSLLFNTMFIRSLVTNKTIKKYTSRIYKLNNSAQSVCWVYRKGLKKTDKLVTMETKQHDTESIIPLSKGIY